MSESLEDHNLDTGERNVRYGFDKLKHSIFA